MITEKAAGNGRRELTMRVPEEMHERLREAAFDLRLSHNEILTKALEMWLDLQFSSNVPEDIIQPTKVSDELD